MSAITIELSAEILQQLEAKAKRQQLSLPEVVQEVIAEYFREEEIEDTPLEKIEADFRQAWQEIMAGQFSPLGNLFEEIRNELRDEQHTETGEHGN